MAGRGAGLRHVTTEYLSFANDLADLADAISMRYFRSDDMTVKRKEDGTPVTIADEEIEKLLRKEIAATYPTHGVFGEEEGDADPDATTRWILDPIDGTKNFSWGIPMWGTLIALEIDGEIVCGVASAPGVGERYAAARGGGATRNGEPIHVSEIDDLAGARVGFTSISGFRRGIRNDGFEALIAQSKHNRGIGDFYGHMLVASGSLDVMVEPELNPWDIAPLIVIVEEAGGRLTTFDGQATIYGGGVITTNGRLHEAVRGLFGG